MKRQKTLEQEIPQQEIPDQEMPEPVVFNKDQDVTQQTQSEIVIPDYGDDTDKLGN